MTLAGASARETSSSVTSIVAVGTYQRTRSPAFQFRGTGFAVAEGLTIVTNAHVLPATIDADKFETIAILVPGGSRDALLRPAARGPVDVEHDLALLAVEGMPLPALALRDSDNVREGESVLFTGFPIGNVLGPFPATHRGMVAAITPIAIPPARSSQLDPAVIRLSGAVSEKRAPQPVLDAVSALINLGYGQPQAAAAIAAASRSAGDGAQTAQLIRLGLKELAK